MCGLLVRVEHGVGPNCFYLAHTTPSVQLTVALGGVKNSSYLTGHCSTHPSTSLCGSERRAVSEQAALFRKHV